MKKLPNRNEMNRFFETHSGTEEISILFVDLDQFKAINDTLGHNVGDLLVQEVGKRLSRFIHNGQQVFRIGGDEFLIILQQSDPVYAQQVAEDVLEKIKNVYHIDGNELYVTASIGVSIGCVHRQFPVYGSFGKLWGAKAYVNAVTDVSIQLYEGETYGLVGESGSGKSTTGRAILGLTPASQGNVLYRNRDVAAMSREEMRKFRKDVQLVFQDLSKTGDEGGQVAKGLTELQLQLKDLDPSVMDFAKSGLLGKPTFRQQGSVRIRAKLCQGIRCQV